jgi:hypothetical protein
MSTITTLRDIAWTQSSYRAAHETGLLNTPNELCPDKKGYDSQISYIIGALTNNNYYSFIRCVSNRLIIKSPAVLEKVRACLNPKN